MESESGVTLITLILFLVILLVLSAVAIRLAIKSVDAEIESSSMYYTSDDAYEVPQDMTNEIETEDDINSNETGSVQDVQPANDEIEKNN